MSRKARGSWWSRLDHRRANAIVGAGVLAVLLALVVIGDQLHDTQTTSRERVVSRFRDRAQVISALTQALVSSAAAPSDATRQYSVPKVADSQLDAAATAGRLAFAALLDQRGTVIAASSDLTPEARARLGTTTAVRTVLQGAPVMLSDVSADSPGGGVIDLAVGLSAPEGRRVLVTGIPTPLVGPFLTSYLKRVPTRDGTAFVLDSRGQVIGARDAAVPLGRRVAEPGLLAGMAKGDIGSYGDDGYFVAIPVASSSWRVVLTASESSLFDSVTGSRKWLPWVIFAALGIVALGFLALLRRLLGIAAALSSANDQLEGTNARLESTNALLRHAAELTRSNAELEQFASIASHDLQEPLRKVQTFAAQLTARESERLSEEGQDHLRRMSNAAGRMRALIDDLLMFSRVSTKGRPFAAVDLEDVVQHVLVDLELSIEESGAQVEVAPLPTIEADTVQMQQLVQNLLGNALKFRREGVPPEITVSATVADGIAELTIRDNGLGFDPQYATRIFRAFERLHGASAYPGTGIGLALCRKIVERHHGTITATGAVGSGATFVIALPVQQVAEDGPPPAMFPEPTSDEVPHALA